MNFATRRLLGNLYQGVKSYSRQFSMEAFTKHGVVSDVIKHAPKEIASLSYGATKVTPGDTLTPTQVKDAPNVSWTAENDAYYTLIENDPDAPR